MKAEHIGRKHESCIRKDPPLQGVFRESTLRILEGVGNIFDVSCQVLKRGGEPYRTVCGADSTVPQNYALISLTPGRTADMGRFWRVVDYVESLSKNSNPPQS